MDLKQCIEAAAADGHLSKGAAEEYLQRLKELEAEPGYRTSRQRAATRLEGEVRRKIERKKRVKLKQAQKQAEITGRLAGAEDRARAAVSVLDFDPSLKYVGPNVSMQTATVRGTAFSLMNEFVDRYRSKAGGLMREKTGLRDVMRALFGENAPREAAEMADAIQAARKFLRGRFNAAGGDIVERKDWGWTQRHDRAAVAAVGKDEWLDFVLPRLDASRMYGPDGTPMTAEELVKAVSASYDNIVSGGLEDMAGDWAVKYASPVNQHVQHRELAFRDADTWLEYQERFGEADIFGSIVGEIDRFSREVAVMEVLGPQPRAMLEHMKKLVDEQRGEQALTETGKAALKAHDKIGKHAHLDNTFDIVTGKANLPQSSGFARFSQGNRNLVTAARLGSALFVSLGDLGTNSLTARYNGLPVTKLLGGLFRQLNPASGADRRMAARAGFVAENWIGHLVAAQRLMGEVTGQPWTARVADTTLRMSGLTAWTDGGRAAFQLELVGHMTDNAGKAFDDVEPTLLASMKRHGITAEDWELYRSTSIWTDPETQAELIRPEDVWLESRNMAILPAEDRARFEAADKFGRMVHTESIFAVVTPTARGRAYTTHGQPAGSFWGEMIRNVTLFKSFMVSHTFLHFSRMMAQRGITGKARYFAWLAISMTAAGGVAEQASDVFRGKEPRDMTEAKFWAAAVARGGSLGPVGDFLYSSTNRHGQNLAEGLLGPVLGGELGDLSRLTAGNIAELITEGEASSVGYELTRFAKGLTPGGSLWYSRVAFDRLIADEMTAMIDGDAAKRFRRIERQAIKDYNQRYWWAPGERSPEF